MRRPFAGADERVEELRHALLNAEFTDQQQVAIRYLAHWLSDDDIKYVVCLIHAARTAEWRSIIDLRAKGRVYGTARVDQVESIQR